MYESTSLVWISGRFYVRRLDFVWTFCLHVYQTLLKGLNGKVLILLLNVKVGTTPNQSKEHSLHLFEYQVIAKRRLILGQIRIDLGNSL